MNSFIFEKIKQTVLQLQKRMLKSCEPISGFLTKECGYETYNPLPTPDKTWREFIDGERWGGIVDTHRWFYKKIKTDAENTYLSVLTGREGNWDASNPQFVVYIDGFPVQGLDVNHTEVLIKGKGEHDVILYAYSGMDEVMAEFNTSLKVYDENVRKLYYDIKVPFDLCELLHSTEKKYIDIMKHLEKAADLIDFRDEEHFKKSVIISDNYIENEFYGKFCGKKKCDAEVVCIGHTHIDIAWLWTVEQTREKALRSFSTVINLMKQFPEYKFMSSQAVLYKFVKEQSPELYAEIKEMIKAGRWEVEGAMWVEADCNLTSGESLVRQILYGKRFFKTEFDIDSKILWLPDVFGYSAALPQILVKSGVTKFLTSKISWSETNKMPNDTFIWQGIDGTEIFSYFLTAQDYKKDAEAENYTTYVGMLSPTQTMGTWKRYQNKDLSREVLLTYGYGDGGGGPTSEMIETGKRLEKGIPGGQSVRFDTAGAFLDKLERNTRNNKELARWVGELYLEFHRGTYTSMAKNKRYNRKCEFLYQTAELAAVTDMVISGNPYPKAEMDKGWEMILLNQFHDIIPGSSIKEVYEVSEREYMEIERLGKGIMEKALGSIAEKVKSDGGVFVYNPLSFENSGIIDVDGEKMYAENIPAKGYKVIKPKTGNAAKLSNTSIENAFFKIKFKNGDILSIYDKKNKRAVIKKGQRANVLQAFEDYPKQYDAWEITSYYKDKMWEIDDVVEMKPFKNGVAAGVYIKKNFLSSVVEQWICVYDDIPRIDFETKIDWKQEHILLKALFPIDVHAEKATYDIQFGTVERPTHKNTSWDAAKFEVCAHKYADISEDGYGVSILNDCKYGYDISGSDMRITLLKSATYPNPDADKGEHNFVYSLYPHAGNHKQGKTVQQAFNLNVPMYAVSVPPRESGLESAYSLIDINAENIIIDTVKRAEDSDKKVVRMYETYNRRTSAVVEFGFDVKKCYIADMSENILSELKVNENSVKLEVKPFEIVTLMVE